MMQTFGIGRPVCEVLDEGVELRCFFARDFLGAAPAQDEGVAAPIAVEVHSNREKEHDGQAGPPADESADEHHDDGHEDHEHHGFDIIHVHDYSS
jgi:hypothetical protein